MELLRRGLGEEGCESFCEEHCLRHCGKVVTVIFCQLLQETLKIVQTMASTDRYQPGCQRVKETMICN